MEEVGTLPETNDVLSPTIIPLFGILSPPAEQEEECHFCLETTTKGQFMIFKLPCCGQPDTTLAQNVSRHGHRILIQNQQYAAHIVQPSIDTKTHASFACKNTPRNSTVQRAVTRKFTQNAQQTSQL